MWPGLQYRTSPAGARSATKDARPRSFLKPDMLRDLLNLSADFVYIMSRHLNPRTCIHRPFRAWNCTAKCKQAASRKCNLQSAQHSGQSVPTTADL